MPRSTLQVAIVTFVMLLAVAGMVVALVVIDMLSILPGLLLLLVLDAGVLGMGYVLMRRATASESP